MNTLRDVGPLTLLESDLYDNLSLQKNIFNLILSLSFICHYAILLVHKLSWINYIFLTYSWRHELTCL